MRERIAKSTCFVKARDLAFTYYRRWPEARRVSPHHCPWRLATAVRGLASCEIRPCGVRYGAAALPRVGMIRRRALRGPGAPAGAGRTETPPAKLSACATCHCARAGGIAHAGGARPYRTSRVHGALLGRRDEDIAPYRHYAREIRTAITHAWCGAITHAKFARVITRAWCAREIRAQHSRGHAARREGAACEV